MSAIKTTIINNARHALAAFRRWVMVPILLAALSPAAMAKTGQPAISTAAIISQIQQISARLKADIGVALLSENGDILLQYQGDKPFPLNSTHKAFSCAMLLAEAQQQGFSFNEVRAISPQDVVDYSPITAQKTSLNLTALCEAAVSYSDNTAANLVMKRLGGVAVFNDYVRQFGLTHTRLDRLEPELNRDNRALGLDLTTPLDAAELLRQFAFGKHLSANNKQQWLQWLIDDQVADDLLRRSLPKGWKIADKSGAGRQGSRSIISIFWTPNGTAYILSIYLTDTQATMTQRNQAIADIGQAVFNSLK